MWEMTDMKERKCDFEQAKKNKQLQKWLKQIADKDSDAMIALYKVMYRPVCFFALSILKNSSNVEDIAQDTFLNIYRNAKQYQEKSSAKTWIFTIVKNLCMDVFREPPTLLEENISYVDGGDFTRLESLEAFQCLDTQEEQIMTLYAFGGMRISEIAALLEIPQRKAYYCRDTAIKKLKAYYAQNQPGKEIK